MTLPAQARILIVGCGIAGRPTAHLLAAPGQQDRALPSPGRPTARGTRRRAGLGERTAGSSARVLFLSSDSENLPFGNSSFDAVICECSFCTFPNKPLAAREIFRVLRPGGRFGMTIARRKT